jgi:hypothetical protein
VLQRLAEQQFLMTQQQQQGQGRRSSDLW